MRKILALVICLVAVVPARSQEPDPIRDFDLQTIERLGQKIVEVDRYAAIATDILFAQAVNLDDYPLRGWIVTETAGGPLVTFVGEYADGLRAVFDVRPDVNSSAQFEIAEGRELTDEELSRFLARQSASRALTEACSDRYNTVVLPDPTGEAWLVYLLAATTEPNLVMAGGHYRITVSSDGRSILSADRLSASCLTLDKAGAEIPEDGEPIMMVMTHIVSSSPIEAHVYLSLLHDMAFAIVTGEKDFWLVQGGRVVRIEP